MVKDSPFLAQDAGDAGSVPGLGRSPGGEHGNPLQCSSLENPGTEGPGGLQSKVLQSWTWLKQLSTHAWSKCEAN